MGEHRVHIPFIGSDAEVVVEGDEARHATRSKRLRHGDELQIFDGKGTIGTGVLREIGRNEIRIEVRETRLVARIQHPVHIYSAVPRGGRIETLIDGVSQTGAASWSPLRCSRSDGGRPIRRDRLERVAIESAKQSGRAWTLEIGSQASIDEVLELGDLVLAHGTGSVEGPPRDGTRRLLIGPEGGFTPAEIDAIMASDSSMISLGPHVLRIETAAIVGTGLLTRADGNSGSTTL